MTVADVETAAGTSLASLGAKGPLGTHYLRRGRTDLWLDFAKDGLSSVQVTQVVGLKKADAAQGHNLCTGGVFSVLYLYLPDSLAGAQVLVDGDLLSAHREQTAFFVDLSPGRHEIRIEKSSRVAIRKVDVTLGGAGEVRVVISESEVSSA